MPSVRKEAIEAVGCEKLVGGEKDGVPHECGRDVAFRSGEDLLLCAHCTVLVLQEQLAEADAKVTYLTHRVGVLTIQLQDARAAGD